MIIDSFDFPTYETSVDILEIIWWFFLLKKKELGK